MKRVTVLLAIVPALAVAPAVAARGTDASRLETPRVFQDLLDCRQLTDPAQRLACYDQKVTTLEQAQQSHDIVVADKAEVHEARKGLFGLSLPSIKLFGGGSDEDEIKQIDAVAKSARQVGYGAWQFTLEDGATWQQIDTQTVVFGPRPGSRIRIRRGALGSFIANIDGQPGIKVRRVQ
ncbi:MAG: hypothetical protein KGL48_00385 [Sphingomonadales bacterium]|nr:hypothetical protein [Sphingomonadales bacterium]MDE2567893.1 hypothetical protein [Sphingomonadales bacterium]